MQKIIIVSTFHFEKLGRHYQGFEIINTFHIIKLHAIYSSDSPISIFEFAPCLVSQTPYNKSEEMVKRDDSQDSSFSLSTQGQPLHLLVCQKKAFPQTPCAQDICTKI